MTQELNGSVLGIEELTRVLEHLDREFSRPLTALAVGLRSRSDRAGGEEASGLAEQVRTLSFLCHDALSLTPAYREYLGLTHECRRRPETRAVRISAMLSEVEGRFVADAEARSLSWACRLDGEDAEVMTDPTLGVEILDQLASNAVRFAPIGGTIVISAGKFGASWRVTVIDDGPGIPESQRDRVLEPFQRLAREVRAEIPGTGLGLARCRAAVDRLRGKISVDSPPVGGTRIVVEIPIG